MYEFYCSEMFEIFMSCVVWAYFLYSEVYLTLLFVSLQL